MPRYKLTIEYEGTRYCGWQRQPNEPSVQAEVEQALAVALRAETSVTASGRTDAGVHALAQVAHFDTISDIDEFRLIGSLNGLLPRDIAVRGLCRIHDSFHARYDATARTYGYYVSTLPVALDRSRRVTIPADTDFDLMNRAANTLIGRNDFSTFCRTQSETKNRVCTVRTAAWRAENRTGDFRFLIEADRFLHGMVRAIVGTLFEVSRGKRTPESLATVLAERDRRLAGPAAPSRGLVLEHVAYGQKDTIV